MQHLLIIAQLVTIIFYIDIQYNTTSHKYVQVKHPEYSAYYSLDVVDNTILTVENLAENKKIEIWRVSPLRQELFDAFPHMERMQDIFKDRVVDNGKFKTSFLNYLIDCQEKYFAGEFSQDEFQMAISNPPASLIEEY